MKIKPRERGNIMNKDTVANGNSILDELSDNGHLSTFIEIAYLLLLESDAENFLSVDFINKENREKYLLTIQKAEGKTPAMELSKLQYLIEAIKYEVNANKKGLSSDSQIIARIDELLKED